MAFTTKDMKILTLCMLCAIMIQSFSPAHCAEATHHHPLDSKTEPVYSLPTNLLGLSKKVISEYQNIVNLPNEASVGHGSSRLRRSLNDYLESLEDKPNDMSNDNVQRLIKELEGEIKKTAIKTSMSQIQNLDAKIADGSVDSAMVQLFELFLAQISNNALNNINGTPEQTALQLLGHTLQLAITNPSETLPNWLQVVLNPQSISPTVSGIPTGPGIPQAIPMNQHCANDTMAIITDIANGGFFAIGPCHNMGVLTPQKTILATTLSEIRIITSQPVTPGSRASILNHLDALLHYQVPTQHLALSK